MAAAVNLEQMRKLAFIQFRLITWHPEEQDDEPSTFDNGRRLVDAWSKACPTLCSISLPKGQLWRKEKDKWHVC